MNAKLVASVIIILGLILGLSTLFIFQDRGITGFAIFGDEPITDPSVVLYLSFNDENDLGKDYSIYDHDFTINGQVTYSTKEFCKWYGCANFSLTDGSDYLTSTTKYKLDNGMAMTYWIYLDDEPGATSQAYYQIGEDSNLKWAEENSWGYNIEWSADTGTAGADGTSTTDDRWVNYFFVYNESHYSVWKNGELVDIEVQNFGNLKYSVGELLQIGAGQFNIDVHGYMDEVVIWNRSDFNSSFISQFYNDKKFGTPPDIDLYVKNIRYTLPFDWADSENDLQSGNMDIIVTIANAGIQDSGNFNYDIILDGNSICSSSASLSAQTETNITCTWSSSFGFHKGKVRLDTGNSIAEDIEVNNNQSLYIPYLSRPYFHFNLSYWQSDLLAYCQDNSNSVAFDSCDWAENFISEDFSEGWDGNDVDPRAKKGRENVYGCLLNDYDPSNEQCQRSRNHLLGWASRNTSSFDNVQSIHELVQVGLIYDTYFPILTEAEQNQIAKNIHDICQAVTNLANTRPDLDTARIISGGNGWGFGSGMAGFCYSIIGVYNENPTLIQNLDDQYWGTSIVDSWLNREVSYLHAFKNSTYAQYQEGLLYKTYSQPHIVENLYFEKRYGLIDSKFDNSLCALARELPLILTDYNYNGNTLRNDENQKFRGIQRGDSNSYQDISDGNFIDWDIALYYGLLCNDQDIKSSMLYLRDLAFTIEDGTNTYPAIYLYKELEDQVTGAASPESIYPKVVFDNANDIYYFRNNYSYTTDTIIQIDGGEERGGGHSQAQGYYLYALGEPFLDYEQVPYEDDVRSEAWKNGISLKDSTQTSEGVNGKYSETCGNSPLNQYYGMLNCPSAYYPDYPDYRRFDTSYGGDIEDYIGTKNADFGGAYVWRPYSNSDPVKEYFVIFNDLLAKRTLVTNNNEGDVYHNFININDEFAETRSGNNITFSRTRFDNEIVKLDIDLIYSTKNMAIGGGESNVNYCFHKTDCSGSNKGLGNYRRTYLYAAESDIDFILSHHWYNNGESIPVNYLSGTDNGLKQGDNIVIFDMNNDGSIIYESINATGWAIAYDDNSASAFNSTLYKEGLVTLVQSNSSFTFNLVRGTDKLVLTANTMTPNSYIDEKNSVLVTIDANELILNSQFTVVKNGIVGIPVVSEAGTKLSFVVESDNDYYTITGAVADVTAPFILDVENSSITSSSAVIQVESNENTNLSVNWGYETLDNTAVLNTYQTSSSVTLAELNANSVIIYSVMICDISGNCASDGNYNFTTLAASEESEGGSASGGAGAGGGGSLSPPEDDEDEEDIEDNDAEPADDSQDQAAEGNSKESIEVNTFGSPQDEQENPNPITAFATASIENLRSNFVIVFIIIMIIAGVFIFYIFRKVNTARILNSLSEQGSKISHGVKSTVRNSKLSHPKKSSPKLSMPKLTRTRLTTRKKATPKKLVLKKRKIKETDLDRLNKKLNLINQKIKKLK